MPPKRSRTATRGVTATQRTRTTGPPSQHPAREGRTKARELEAAEDTYAATNRLKDRTRKTSTPVGTPRTRASLGAKASRGSLSARDDYAPPPSAQQQRARTESTPMAGDTSIAALAHFRRRPRQPSLLHMIQNPAEDFDSSELNLDTTLDTESSPVFAPHDESTPQPQPRTQIAAPVFHAPDAEDDLYTLSPRPRHGRKRKSNEISGSEVVESVQIEVARSQTPTRGAVSSSSLSAARSSPTPPAASSDSNGSSTPRRADIDAEVYADPLSSSPSSSPLSSPAKPAPTKSSRKTEKPAAPSTAMLRALLPRRQNRRTGHADSSSDEASLPDESEFLTSRRRRRPSKTHKPARKVLGEVKGRRNVKAPATKGRAGKGTSKPSAGGKENAVVVGRRTKTYSRRSEAEAEGTDDEAGQDQSGQVETGLSKELRAARDKFRRIDEGELEFESASLGESGSSPWR